MRSPTRHRPPLPPLIPRGVAPCTRVLPTAKDAWLRAQLGAKVLARRDHAPPTHRLGHTVQFAAHGG